MGEVDEVHHAEHQRQAGRDQEQQDAELQPVEGLDHEKGGGHGLSDPRAGRDPGHAPSSRPNRSALSTRRAPNRRAAELHIGRDGSSMHG